MLNYALIPPMTYSACYYKALIHRLTLRLIRRLLIRRYNQELFFQNLNQSNCLLKKSTLLIQR